MGMNLGGTANVPGGSAKMEMAHHSSSFPMARMPAQQRAGCSTLGESDCS